MVFPECKVVYDAWAAVAGVVQGRVIVVEGRMTVLLLDVLWQQMGEPEKTTTTTTNQNRGIRGALRKSHEVVLREM